MDLCQSCHGRIQSWRVAEAQVLQIGVGLVCGCRFHANCIYLYLLRQSKCPICNEPIVLHSSITNRVNRHDLYAQIKPLDLTIHDYHIFGSDFRTLEVPAENPTHPYTPEGVVWDTTLRKLMIRDKLLEIVLHAKYNKRDDFVILDPSFGDSYKLFGLLQRFDAEADVGEIGVSIPSSITIPNKRGFGTFTLSLGIQYVSGILEKPYTMYTMIHANFVES